MKMNNNRSILRKAIDQVTGLVREQTADNYYVSDRLRTIGTFLVALSGLVLYTDKALTLWEIDLSIYMPEKFIKQGFDFSYFVWLLAQTISPFLIFIGVFLRAYIYVYIIPIYCYALQAHFLLSDFALVDDSYGHFYAFGISFLFLVVGSIAQTAQKKSTKYLIEKAKKNIFKIKNERK